MAKKWGTGVVIHTVLLRPHFIIMLVSNLYFDHYCVNLVVAGADGVGAGAAGGVGGEVGAVLLCPPPAPG